VANSIPFHAEYGAGAKGSLSYLSKRF